MPMGRTRSKHGQHMGALPLGRILCNAGRFRTLDCAWESPCPASGPTAPAWPLSRYMQFGDSTSGLTQNGPRPHMRLYQISSYADFGQHQPTSERSCVLQWKVSTILELAQVAPGRTGSRRCSPGHSLTASGRAAWDLNNELYFSWPRFSKARAPPTGPHGYTLHILFLHISTGRHPVVSSDRLHQNLPQLEACKSKAVFILSETKYCGIFTPGLSSA